MIEDAENVVRFPGDDPDAGMPPRGTQLLAGLVIVTNGLVRIAGIAATVGIMLLAAIGAVSLLGGLR